MRVLHCRDFENGRHAQSTKLIWYGYLIFILIYNHDHLTKRTRTSLDKVFTAFGFISLRKEWLMGRSSSDLCWSISNFNSLFHGLVFYFHFHEKQILIHMIVSHYCIAHQLQHSRIFPYFIIRFYRVFHVSLSDSVITEWWLLHVESYLMGRVSFDHMIFSKADRSGVSLIILE